MDEATSALDNETERRIVEALENLQGEHTLIVIAHRLSTVRNCNTLFFLRDGQLEAAGSYDELLATNETFRQMAGENVVGEAIQRRAREDVGPGRPVAVLRSARLPHLADARSQRPRARGLLGGPSGSAERAASGDPPVLRRHLLLVCHST